MRQPPPRRSKFSKYYISNDDVDYNMKSPLGGKNVYPCRGTQAGPNEGTLSMEVMKFLVPVVKYPAKDTLPDLLDSRQLVTVGEPVESTDTSTNAAEATQEDKKDEDGEVKEANDQDGRQRNESESAASNDEQEAEDGGDQGTVVMYVSESTATTTQVVYVSEYVTEEDTLRAQYTYGAGIQTKGQLSTTLGPYAKPLFGTNVGLTVIPDTTSLASTNLIPFTDESLSITF
ncbi:hypothetical protein GGI07_000574 [Coemansia sp. Benny D115]|nr:hypothetical protein GGI07_000574 [Coemansia sp. Benny D115]